MVDRLTAEARSRLIAAVAGLPIFNFLGSSQGDLASNTPAQQTASVEIPLRVVQRRTQLLPLEASSRRVSRIPRRRELHSQGRARHVAELRLAPCSGQASRTSSPCWTAAWMRAGSLHGNARSSRGRISPSAVSYSRDRAYQAGRQHERETADQAHAPPTACGLRASCSSIGCAP